MRIHLSPDGTRWQEIGPALAASRLSDDDGQGRYFTGAFGGQGAQDQGGTRVRADFNCFSLHNESGAT